jgi:E3 ubiquitin-protein ligase SHPRH
MLRRSKKDVANELDLPPCTREDLSVVLSTAERAAYERLKREFLDAVKQYKRHHDASANFVRNEHNYAEESSRNRALTKASARTYASLTSLRQSTCHPQMVAANTALLGSERLSMTDIIDRLVTQAYGEFDTALRAVFDALVYQLAVGTSLTGDDPATSFDSLMQSIDDNALIAGLLMLPRNDVISLRNETGSLNRAAFGGAEEVVVRQRLVALENADAEECLQEDDELEEAREVYRQQLNEIAEKWDKENADKEGPKKKKVKGGGRNKNANCGASGSGAGAAGGVNDDGGEPVATRTGPSFKAKRYARNELGPMPDLPPRRRQLRREAATRRRNWDRFKLAILELKLHLIKEELGIVKSKWTDKAKERAAERKELGESNPQASFEATVQELDTLRAELGLIPDFGPTTATKCSPGGASGSKSAAGGASGSGAGGSEAIPKDTTNGNEGNENGADTTADAMAAAALIDNAAHIRRSRRQAGIDADSTAEITLDPEELAAQLENAVIMVRQYKSMCAGRKPAELVQRHRDTAETEAKELFHRLKFVQQQHKDVTRLANMTVAANGGASGSGGAGSEEQDDLTRCPICFDDLTTTPLTMTRCSHRFCTDCISESLQRAAPQPAPCPICRTELRQSDLFEALSEAEAVVAARAAAATNSATSEYGAKVAAVLDILRDMKEDSEGAKCVIFSSWGRALRLVGDALTANRVKFASLVGASTKRAAFLDEFMHDPECTVLLVLMSTSGGAAGLTLVNATTAILLEPCFNPGLEAQAAARIHRMGQIRPTRVVRLIAEESVDAQIAEEQRRKFEAGDTAAGSIKSDEADYGTIVALADRLAASTTVAEAMEEDTGPAAVARPGGDGGAGPSQPGRVINASRRR